MSITTSWTLTQKYLTNWEGGGWESIAQLGNIINGYKEEGTKPHNSTEARFVIFVKVHSANNVNAIACKA